MNSDIIFQRLAALCAKGEHCQHDMIEKMRRWEVDDETQAAVMARLVKERYVDDERYTRAFVHDKIAYNQWGRKKIEQALWMKHIDGDTARRVLDEVDDEDYLNVLQPLLKQKSKSVKGANDYERRMKLMKWAAGRGFTFDIIRQCLGNDGCDDYFD
jgi:regulatory protein